MLTTALVILLSGTDAREAALQRAMQNLDQAIELVRTGCRADTVTAELTRLRTQLRNHPEVEVLNTAYADLRGAGISAGLTGCGPTVGTAIEQALSELEAATQAPAPKEKTQRLAGTAVEIFEDEGVLFIRAGKKQGLTAGGVVKVLGEEKKSIGTAAVLEVWDSIARISPDAKARQGEPRFALVAAAKK
jgi:hypothetical protein